MRRAHSQTSRRRTNAVAGGAVSLGLALSLAAPAVADPVSVSDNATSETGNTPAVSVLGCATARYALLAVSGTGCADSAFVAISGTGNAGYRNPDCSYACGGGVSISGTGCAQSYQSAVGGSCSRAPVAVAGTGSAESTQWWTVPFVGFHVLPGVALSGTGSATGGALAVSGTGSSNATGGHAGAWAPLSLETGAGTSVPGAGVSAAGNARGSGAAVAPAGDATTTGFVAVSVAGNARGGSVANVTVLGDDSG